MCTVSTLTTGHQSSVWAVWVLLLCWADYCGWHGRLSCPLAWLVARPCLAWRLLAACWQDWVTRQLAAESWGNLGSLVGGVGIQEFRGAGACPPVGECRCWG